MAFEPEQDRVMARRRSAEHSGIGALVAFGAFVVALVALAERRSKPPIVGEYTRFGPPRGVTHLMIVY
jgi:hypothetical protein